MGAWGYDPLDNDYALDWAAECVENALVASIKGALSSYLGGGFADDVKKHEVEAAIAVLIALCDIPGRGTVVAAHIANQAREEGLWEAAIQAIAKLKADIKWLGAWNSPDKKSKVLDGLLADVVRRTGNAES